MLTYSIDFGTSNSLLAAADESKIYPPLALDPSNTDPSIFRSLMFFPFSGPTVFGQAAIREYVDSGGDGRFLRSIKKFLPLKTFTSTRIGNTSYSLEELISRFLSEMKARADENFNQDVTSVVLGRPARFSMVDEEDKLAQGRLEKAAQMAGFKHIEFLEEPLAAAFALKSELNKPQTVLIVDLGGGTSDFTVIRLGPDDHKKEDVLALGGISVAGDALDGSIMTELVAPHFGSQMKYKLPMSDNVHTISKELKYRLCSPADITMLSRSDLMHYLKDTQKASINQEGKLHLDRLFTLIEDNLGFHVFEEIERSKRQVCKDDSSTFSYHYPGIDLDLGYTHSDFNAYSEDKIESIMKSLDDTLKAAGVKNNEIDLICCTGGTSQVPEVAKQLEKRFGKEKIRTRQQFHSVIQGLTKKALKVNL